MARVPTTRKHSSDQKIRINFKVTVPAKAVSVAQQIGAVIQ